MLTSRRNSTRTSAANSPSNSIVRSPLRTYRLPSSSKPGRNKESPRQGHPEARRAILWAEVWLGSLGDSEVRISGASIQLRIGSLETTPVKGSQSTHLNWNRQEPTAPPGLQFERKIYSLPYHCFNFPKILPTLFSLSKVSMSPAHLTS